MDEGIEAMLCCWLQQLQEFGGPEVDKPDLLKGSIGSLKNLGLNNTTVKNNSGTGSLAKQNAFIDRRARYNVSSSPTPLGNVQFDFDFGFAGEMDDFMIEKWWFFSLF